MKIAVLFDGAGLARLGLEKAGHECVGVELDPRKHHLSKMLGRGHSVLADVRDFDLSGFDAIWASPPCSTRSTAIKDLTGRGGGCATRSSSRITWRGLCRWAQKFCGWKT